MYFIDIQIVKLNTAISSIHQFPMQMILNLNNMSTHFYNLCSKIRLSLLMFPNRVNALEGKLAVL
jgi:hypothetical protein